MVFHIRINIYLKKTNPNTNKRCSLMWFSIFILPYLNNGRFFPPRIFFCMIDSIFGEQSSNNDAKIWKKESSFYVLPFQLPTPATHPSAFDGHGNNTNTCLFLLIYHDPEVLQLTLLYISNSNKKKGEEKKSRDLQRGHITSWGTCKKKKTCKRVGLRTKMRFQEIKRKILGFLPKRSSLSLCCLPLEKYAVLLIGIMPLLTVWLSSILVLL